VPPAFLAAGFPKMNGNNLERVRSDRASKIRDIEQKQLYLQVGARLWLPAGAQRARTVGRTGRQRRQLARDPHCLPTPLVS
jgi:hypothetical protein